MILQIVTIWFKITLVLVSLLFKLAPIEVRLIFKITLLLVYFYFVLDETDTSRFVQVRSVKRKHFIFSIGVLV